MQLAVDGVSCGFDASSGAALLWAVHADLRRGARESGLVLHRLDTGGGPPIGTIEVRHPFPSYPHDVMPAAQSLELQWFLEQAGIDVVVTSRPILLRRGRVVAVPPRWPQFATSTDESHSGEDWTTLAWALADVIVVESEVAARALRTQIPGASGVIVVGRLALDIDDGGPAVTSSRVPLSTVGRSRLRRHRTQPPSPARWTLVADRWGSAVVEEIGAIEEARCGDQLDVVVAHPNAGHPRPEGGTSPDARILVSADVDMPLCRLIDLLHASPYAHVWCAPALAGRLPNGFLESADHSARATLTGGVPAGFRPLSDRARAMLSVSHLEFPELRAALAEHRQDPIVALVRDQVLTQVPTIAACEF